MKHIIIMIMLLPLAACSMQSLVDASLPPAGASEKGGHVPPYRPPPQVGSPAEAQTSAPTASRKREIQVNQEEQFSPAVAQLLAQSEQYLEAQQPQQAIQVLERASRIAPRSATVYARLAEVYQLQGQAQKAQVFASKARSLKPSFTVLNRLAKLNL